MRLQELVVFRSDLYFEGAVQADWFYKQDKATLVASNYVFHGPSTHAIAQKDDKGKALLDTARFVKRVAENITDRNETKNPFTLAIAGYGTGKSHLAVTLSQLLSGRELNPDVFDKIMVNLAHADRASAESTRPSLQKPRLVLTLNGMRDFNLHYELLRTAQKALGNFHMPSDFVRALNRANETARHFIELSFDTLTAQFEAAAGERGFGSTGTALKQELLDRLDNDEAAFRSANQVYTAINGHTIRWDEGVSASAVLETLLHDCCGTRGHFDSIVILFDEFGRFLEYVGTNPTAAGDSALQQIFESVQNAEGDIQFIGFIQSDIKTYLQRVDKASNISRYIDRFDASEKIYLSSNLETIFANLLDHPNQEAYQACVLNKLTSRREQWQQQHEYLQRWLPLQNAWQKFEDYNQLILKNIYPLHPISVYLLSNLTDWLQNRSSLTLLNEKIKEHGQDEMDDPATLPMIYPIDLLHGSFFNELLNAEEQGRQRSQFCILLQNILRRLESKLSKAEQDILFANLILRICRFRFPNRDEIEIALSYCADRSLAEVKAALAILENEYAVLSFDDRAICLDFIADSVGATDFRNYVRGMKRAIRFTPEMLSQEAVLELFELDEPILTNFATERGIQTKEWCFVQQLIHIDQVTPILFANVLSTWRNATDPETAKGSLLWVYMDRDTTHEKLALLNELSTAHALGAPICTFLINDAEDRLKDALIEYRVYISMPTADQVRFQRFYDDGLKKAMQHVSEQFASMKLERQLVSKDGVVGLNSRLGVYLTGVFTQIYPSAVPFDFDGFQLKSIAKARKQFCAINKWMLIENMNYQALKSQTVDVRNRVESLLGRKALHSWKAVNEEYHGITPSNERVQTIYRIVEQQLFEEKSLDFGRLLLTLEAPPYGFNDYSAFLFIALLCVNLSYTSKLIIDGKLLNPTNWADIVVFDMKIDIPKVAQTKMLVVDVAEAEKRFLNLFRRIADNTDFSVVASLDAELSALLREENVPEAMNSDYALAGFKIAEGAAAAKSYDRKIAEIQTCLDTASREKDAYSAMNAAKMAEDIAEKPASQNATYQYTDAQLRVLSHYVMQARTIAENLFETWIPKQVCLGMGGLSTYEKHIKRVKDMMYSLNFSDAARALQAICDREVSNKKIMIARQSLQEDCESFLHTSVVQKGTSLKSLEEMRDRGQIIHKVFNSFSYEGISQMRSAEKRLSDRLQQIDKAIEAQRKTLSDIWNDIYGLETLRQAELILLRLQAILSSGLDEKDRLDFENISTFLQQFVTDARRLANAEKDRSRVDVFYQALLTQYGSEDCELELAEIVECIYYDKVHEMDALEKEWQNEYLLCDFQSMNESQLDSWRKKTDAAPAYLTAETLSILEQKKKQAEECLSDKKIAYIALLFGQLTDEERQRCLAVLRID